MSNDELDRLLKAARPPEKSAGYWREFPRLMRRKAAAARHRAAPAEVVVSPVWPRWAVAAGLASVLCVAALLFRTVPRPPPSTAAGDAEMDVLHRVFTELCETFPNQLRAVELGHDGPKVLLAEKPTVAAELPLLLRVCVAGDCHLFATFSGQMINVDGRQFEVLVNGRGEVLLVRDGMALSTDTGTATVPGWKLSGKVLHAI